MENPNVNNWSKGKKIREPIRYDQQKTYRDNEMEKAYPISQDQLNGAKLFTSREEYAKTLKKNISYLEAGVAWGNSAKMFIDTANAISADLLDLYNNAAGTREPGGLAPTDDSITHEQHIKNKFAYHPNVRTIKGDIKDVYHTINKNYDLIFFDMETERLLVRNLLLHFSKLVNIEGVIGFTSYINYDAIHYEMPVGIFQSVNEFLYFNHNWSVDAIVLHNLGFHDIYIKRNQ